jgi:tetratricopeptide (TPR) repeat protein
LMAKDPQHILLHNHLANSYTLLANCLLDSGDTKSAIEYYRKAVAARLTLSEKSPNSSANRGALAECYANLAKALGSSDRGAALKQYSNAVELLEPLTDADRSNVQYRIVLADALSNTARLYVLMAGKDEEPSTRLQSWTSARSFYQRSEALWLELERAGRLPTSRARAIRAVSGELARCDDSVAKLQRVH